MQFQALAAKLREFGPGVDGEIVPSGISARHKRHLATVVMRQYQTLCDDLTALVGRCRDQTGGADVSFVLRESEDGSQAYDAVFTDGDKVLTAYSEAFADAAKWANATALIEPVQAHYVAPDDEAAFRSHKTARATAHRNAACDVLEAALVEMRASLGLGRCGRRSRLPNDSARRVVGKDGVDGRRQLHLGGVRVVPPTTRHPKSAPRRARAAAMRTF